MFEFLHPDKSPQNARMPKREKTKNIQNEQPTHTPHPHNKIPPEVSTNTPRSFAKTTIAHSKFRMCIDAKFPHALICTPKFHNAPKSKVSDYLKRPSKFPPTQQSTPKFPYTHEVREFLTIQHPNAPDQTPTPHPRSLSGSLIASKIRYFSRENFTPWGFDRPPPAPPRTGGNPSVCVPKNA